MDAVLRARLEGGEIALRIDLGRDLENIFRTYGDAQTTALAAIFIDSVVVSHSQILLI
jgi:hypothetical protein